MWGKALPTSSAFSLKAAGFEAEEEVLQSKKILPKTFSASKKSQITQPATKQCVLSDDLSELEGPFLRSVNSQGRVSPWFGEMDEHQAKFELLERLRSLGSKNLVFIPVTFFLYSPMALPLFP